MKTNVYKRDFIVTQEPVRRLTESEVREEVITQGGLPYNGVDHALPQQVVDAAEQYQHWYWDSDMTGSTNIRRGTESMAWMEAELSPEAVYQAIWLARQWVNRDERIGESVA